VTPSVAYRFFSLKKSVTTEINLRETAFAAIIQQYRDKRTLLRFACIPPRVYQYDTIVLDGTLLIKVYADSCLQRWVLSSTDGITNFT
jgi:hypothetical protein